MPSVDWRPFETQLQLGALKLLSKYTFVITARSQTVRAVFRHYRISDELLMENELQNI